MIQIFPSIIANSQKELIKRYNKIKSIPILHLDVMDGDFVKNISLWFKFKLPKHKYQAHLMTYNPETFIGIHHNEIDLFIVHTKTLDNVDDFLSFMKRIRKKVYFALNPKDSVASIKKYLRKINGVMVMAVEPGKYGARFIPSALNKIKALRRLSRKLNIEVDGSVNKETIKKMTQAGANQFSVGSYIQKSKSARKAIEQLKKAYK
jgi:ribulose-phosphate 3-epimerase